MKIAINPMAGWGNDPYVELIGYKVPDREAVIYTRENDGCYWYQNPDTGDTDFLFNDNHLKEVGENKWQAMRKTEGFGGRTFVLNVHGYGEVKLFGAWSGGCYCANKYLPKPATEVAAGGLATYLTIEKVNEALVTQGSLWRVVETVNHLNEYWITCAYDGVEKKKMDKDVLTKLQEEYNKKYRSKGQLFRK